MAQEITLDEWEACLNGYPNAHLLQTRQWGDLKSAFGWQPRWVAGEGCGAQVLFRRLPVGLSMAYIPRGPVLSERAPDFQAAWAQLGPVLDAISRQERAIALKIEPDGWVETGQGTATLPPAGFRLSRHSIQPPRTITVSLDGEESLLLSRMKQKTRYNIRLAQKKGVVVRPWDDLAGFHTLMQVTGRRDAFGVHSLAYYRRAYEIFHPQGACELLVAEVEGTPAAAVMVFAHGRRAWYFYGASSNERREWMPSYLLQWEAMRWARNRGCREYDLWGVPDYDEATLEAGFETARGGLWGVYRFKRGFGGVLRRAAGPWDRVYHPALYALYTLWASRRGEG